MQIGIEWYLSYYPSVHCTLHRRVALAETSAGLSKLAGVIIGQVVDMYRTDHIELEN